MSLAFAFTLAAALAAQHEGAPNGSGSPDLAAKKRDIDQLIAPVLEANLIPGLVIAVVDRHGSEVFGYGRERDAQEIPPGGETVFEIGSVSKLFCALLLAEMAERNELKLDDPAEIHVPDGVRVPEHGGKKITLVELASHTSGLPLWPSNLRSKDPTNPYRAYGPADLHAFLAGAELSTDPGEAYAYSNVGFALLAEALADREKKPFAALVEERIFAPLAMKSTGTTLDDSMKYRLAEGHDASGIFAAPWETNALQGALGVHSTANDLLTFLRANMGLEKSPLAGAIAVSHAERFAIGCKRSAQPAEQGARTCSERNPGFGGKVALGWHILEDGATYWHHGETGGHHAFIAFQKKAAVGAVVLANRVASEVDAIGFGVMKILAGQRPQAIELARRSKDEGKTADAAQPNGPSVQVDPKARKAMLDRWVGPYLSGDWTPSLVVALVEGKRADYLRWGRESATRAKPPDENTVFEVGSVTKAFTGVLLADMALKNEVRLEDGVERHLPAGTRIPVKSGRRITLADLALQRSGLPRVASNLVASDPFDEYAGYSSSQLYDFLATASLDAAPGERYEFSNVGYALLGDALAHRAHKSFASLLYDRISVPLGLRHTSIAFEVGSAHLAEGHDAPGVPRPPWTLTNSVFDAALGLHSTAKDLVRFVRASFQKTKSPLEEALQRAQAIQKPREGGGASALGWEVLSDRRTFYQSGKTAGHRAFVAFDPEKRAGVVVLANAAGAPIEGLGLAALSMLEGKPKDPAPLRRTLALDAKAIDDLTGVYEIARRPVPEKVRVRRDGARLYLIREGMPEVPIYAESPTHYYGRGTDVEIDRVKGGLMIHIEDTHDFAQKKL